MASEEIGALIQVIILTNIELLGMRMEDLEFGKQGVHIRFRPDNENGARAKAGYGNDRFVHLPTDVLGLLDVYLTEVWIEASPATDHLWIVLKKEAKSREGRSTHATALVRSYLQDGEAVDWKFVQERLGHASVVTTMQTYTHLTNEDRKQAYERYQQKRRAVRVQQRTSAEP